MIHKILLANKQIESSRSPILHLSLFTSLHSLLFVHSFVSKYKEHKIHPKTNCEHVISDRLMEIKCVAIKRINRSAENSANKINNHWNNHPMGSMFWRCGFVIFFFLLLRYLAPSLFPSVNIFSELWWSQKVRPANPCAVHYKKL